MMERNKFEVKPNRLYKDINSDDIKEGDIVLADVCSYYNSTANLMVSGRKAIMELSDYNMLEKSVERVQKELISKIGQKIIAVVKHIEDDLLILERNSIVLKTVDFLKNQKNQIIQATVESFVPYGVFVDIGNGVISLLHVIEISKNRYSNIKTIFKQGDIINVMILDYNEEENFFIISRKKAYEQKELKHGEFVEAICALPLPDKTGIYVEYNPAMNGLMDIPEDKSFKDFKEGQKVIVAIKSCNQNCFRCNFFAYSSN